MATNSSTDWHIAIIGGFKPRGAWRVKARTFVLTLIGGAGLDLSQAQFTSDDTEITTFSLVGGVDITVPMGIQVDVKSFRILGGVKREDNHPASPTDRIVKVRSYGLLGGTHIHF